MSTQKRFTLAALLDDVAGRIERWSALDRPAEPVADAVEKTLGSPPVRDLLSGSPLGHPLHPLLVAVPIGSWSSAMVFDLLGDRRAARRLTMIGILAALPTMISGLSDWRYTQGAERRVGLVHAGANLVALTAYGASWVARRRGRHLTGVAWSAAGGTALGVGGWLGGHLAYALGVGVDTTAFQHGTASWTDVAADADVRQGELLAAEVDRVPLVLTRTSAGEVVALADRCTHRGGPLSDGEVIDDCIVCPWHESRFASDGVVVEGPASRPQPSYAVRIEGGRVLVERTDEPRTLRINPVGV